MKVIKIQIANSSTYKYFSIKSWLPRIVSLGHALCLSRTTSLITHVLSGSQKTTKKI